MGRRISMRSAREIFVDDLKIVFVIEFGGRKDAEFVSGLEEGDRDHEVAAKLEGVGLGERKIVRHI
jgi:hypothetical protein